MPEHPIITAMWRQKQQGLTRTPAYCTITAPVELQEWNHQWPPEGENLRIYAVPAGVTLKIVMVSRLGDIGLTDDLDAAHGYKVRLMPDDKRLTAFRWEREAGGQE